MTIHCAIVPFLKVAKLPSILLSPWAITEEGLKLVLAVASRDEFFSEVRKEALNSRDGAPLENAKMVSLLDGVAVLPISGPLFRHATLLTKVSAAGSYEQIMRDFKRSVDSDEVKAIVLDIDSPGGEVHGCGELSTFIYNNRGKKPIIAYVSGMMCSAAYWLGSAADEIITDPSGVIGSIGVRTVMVDDSKRDEMAGIREYDIVSSQSPYKVADASRPEDRDRVRDGLSAMATVFVDDVARNRGVSADTVLKEFGKGDTFVGKDAIGAGLVDKVGNLEFTIKELSGSKKILFGVQAMTNKETEAKYMESDASCDACGDAMKHGSKMVCGSCYADAKADMDDDDDDDGDGDAKAQVLLALGVETYDEAVGAIQALLETAGDYAVLKEKHEALEAEKAKAEVASTIESAIKSRKVADAKRPQLEALAEKHGLDALKSFVEVMGKTGPAPAAEPPIDLTKMPVARDKGIDELLKATGISQEDFSNHKTKLRALTKDFNRSED